MTNTNSNFECRAVRSKTVKVKYVQCRLYNEYFLHVLKHGNKDRIQVDVPSRNTWLPTPLVFANGNFHSARSRRVQWCVTVWLISAKIVPAGILDVSRSETCERQDHVDKTVDIIPMLAINLWIQFIAWHGQLHFNFFHIYTIFHLEIANSNKSDTYRDIERKLSSI